jgi:hypothetical protein
MKRIYVGFNLFYNVYTLGKRTIYAPSKDLKDIQRRILNFIKTKYKVKLCIKDAAKVHCGQKWLLKLDIKSFYESFSKKQIKNAISEICFKVEFPPKITPKIIYQYCTVEDKLPTGAATSCHLANIAFEKTKIDDILIKFCKDEGINFSRYMDDMFFSSNSKSTLKKAEKFAISLLNKNGFDANHEKTQYICENKRQEVLGLVINNPENCVIAYDLKHKYRSLFFNYLKAVYLEERLGVNALFKKKIGYKEITGYLAYIKATDRVFYESIKKFLISKINKFGIYDNEEIKKLRKIINRKQKAAV